MAYLTIKNHPYDPKTAWGFQLKKQQIDVSKLDLAKANSWWASVKEAEQTTVVANIKSWLKTNGYSGKDLKIAAVPALSLHGKTSGGKVSKGSMTIEFLVKEVDTAVLKRLEIKDAAASKIRSIIGLSQYGAKKAAEQGKSYSDILAFYFDKTSLTTLYQVPSVDAETKPDLAPVAPAPIPVDPGAAKPAPESSNPAPMVVVPATETAKPAPAPSKPAPAPTMRAVVKDTKSQVGQNIF